jgi:hypothetical protein
MSKAKIVVRYRAENQNHASRQDAKAQRRPRLVSRYADLKPKKHYSRRFKTVFRTIVRRKSGLVFLGALARCMVSPLGFCP